MKFTPRAVTHHQRASFGSKAISRREGSHWLEMAIQSHCNVLFEPLNDSPRRLGDEGPCHPPVGRVNPTPTGKQVMFEQTVNIPVVVRCWISIFLFLFK